MSLIVRHPLVAHSADILGLFICERSVWNSKGEAASYIASSWSYPVITSHPGQMTVNTGQPNAIVDTVHIEPDPNFISLLP